MYELFADIAEKCALRVDVLGWHLSAQGVFGIAAVLIIALLVVRRPRK